MDFENYFPVWDQCTDTQKERIKNSLSTRQVKQGTMIHNGTTGCTGLILVQSGQLRAFITNEEGREVTLYRLLDMDVCLFSASCMLNSLQFEINVEAEKDTAFWIIPADVIQDLMTESTALAKYVNELMASRFSDVLFLIEQVMWKSMDKRVAAFLLEEANLNESNTLKITHVTIANHIGTHREVVTRILRYLQNEKMIQLTRGEVTILNPDLLSKQAED